MSRIRVLQVIDNLGMGGAETWLVALLRHWRDDPHAPQMEFLTTGCTVGRLDAEARDLGARIHSLPFTRRTLPDFARGFRKLLRERTYDAIHDHQDYASGWHFMIGGDLLPPVRITHVHNPAYQIRMNYGVTRARRITARIGKALVARRASHIVGTSRQMLTEWGFDDSPFGGIPKAALHCGFDPARFLQDREYARNALLGEFDWPAETRLALFAGRIDVSPDPAHYQAHKNAGFSVDLAIAAARRDPSFRLLLAGAPSPAVPILQQRIAEAGLADRIVFAGVRRDIEQLMAAADVLLFPSRGEGLGMVAVEGQAAGLSVLASSAVPQECVVVPELVRFRDLADGPQSWVDDLLSLAAMPRDAVAANRMVAESQFAIANSANALARLYGTGQLC